MIDGSDANVRIGIGARVCSISFVFKVSPLALPMLYSEAFHWTIFPIWMGESGIAPAVCFPVVLIPLYNSNIPLRIRISLKPLVGNSIQVLKRQRYI